MIKVENLTKKYGKNIAVDDISFSIKTGRIAGFLGPNGAGKTTTLKMITGFLQPDSGTIMFDELDLADDYLDISANVGYLPEDNPLYTNQRVDEFIKYFADIKGGVGIDSIEVIIKKCGIKEVLKQKIDTLSKGYRQRVGLAKALLGDPKYLILDEPTTGLDPNQKVEILELIQSLAQEKTIIFSSHILSEVKEIADEIIIINKGEIVAAGEPKELTTKFFKGEIINVSVSGASKEFIEKASKINTISEIELIGSSRKKYKEHLVYCEDSEKTAEKLFDLVVKNKWKLVKLNTEKQNLEGLFKQLTNKLEKE